jgi:hypothetical protein
MKIEKPQAPAQGKPDPTKAEFKLVKTAVSARCTTITQLGTQKLKRSLKMRK